MSNFTVFAIMFDPLSATVGGFPKIFVLSTLPKTYILCYNSMLNIIFIKIDQERHKARSMFFPFYAFLKLLWVGLYQISPVWHTIRAHAQEV